MVKCEICGNEYKGLTHSHLKAHNITFQEYNTLYKPETPEEKRLKKITNFLNVHYITVRYRWLLYLSGRDTPITIDKYKNKAKNKDMNPGDKKKRTYSLSDSDIKRHLNGFYTLGVFFMHEPNESKFIGLDLDIKDTELLERIFTALFTYGIERKNILMSFSGNKGYHIDIFLNGLLDKSIINDFYTLLLHDLSISDKVLELRGGSGSGYKLPFGYSSKTGNYCYPCNEYGKQLDDMESIEGIEKLDIQVIANAIELNEIVPRINEVQAVELEELRESVNLLDIYDSSDRIKRVEESFREGIHDKGSRHNTVFEWGLYYKSIKGYCQKETFEAVRTLIEDKWTSGAEPEQFIKNELESIITKVYQYPYKFRARKSDLTQVSEAEIQEIFSIKTGNKSTTESLKRLYYAMLIHSKAFADTKGYFFMTYEQIKNLTCNNSDNKTIRKHIGQLETLGKIERVEPPEKYKKGANIKSNPIHYRLLVEIPNQNYGSFMVCGNKAKCKDCMYIAYGFLVENKPIPEGRQCNLIAI